MPLEELKETIEIEKANLIITNLFILKYQNIETGKPAKSKTLEQSAR